MSNPRHFRAHGRRPVHLRATVHVARPAWHSDATILNIGLGGAALALASAPPEPPPTGPSALKVMLAVSTTKNDATVILPAQVRWVRPATTSEPARAGVSFVLDEPTHASALLELLTSLGPEV